MTNVLYSNGLNLNYDLVCRTISKLQGGVVSHRVKKRQREGLEGMFSEISREYHGSADATLLTKRELEVLELVAVGHSTKEVAARLGISVKTACCHRYRIMSKFGASNGVAMVRAALQQGLIEL